MLLFSPGPAVSNVSQEHLSAGVFPTADLYIAFLSQYFGIILDYQDSNSCPQKDLSPKGLSVQITQTEGLARWFLDASHQQCCSSLENLQA